MITWELAQKIQKREDMVTRWAYGVDEVFPVPDDIILYRPPFYAKREKKKHSGS